VLVHAYGDLPHSGSAIPTPYHPRTSSRHLLEPGESPHIATRSSSLATHSSSPRRIKSISPLARTRLLLSGASRSRCLAPVRRSERPPTVRTRFGRKRTGTAP